MPSVASVLSRQVQEVPKKIHTLDIGGWYLTNGICCIYQQDCNNRCCGEDNVLCEYLCLLGIPMPWICCWRRPGRYSPNAGANTFVAGGDDAGEGGALLLTVRSKDKHQFGCSGECSSCEPVCTRYRMCLPATKPASADSMGRGDSVVEAAVPVGEQPARTSGVTTDI